jgi:hypothetical protein
MMTIAANVPGTTLMKKTKFHDPSKIIA